MIFQKSHSLINKQCSHYDRTRGNVSFTELSELRDTLKNQDFAGLEKFNKL